MYLVGIRCSRTDRIRWPYTAWLKTSLVGPDVPCSTLACSGVFSDRIRRKVRGNREGNHPQKCRFWCDPGESGDRNHRPGYISFSILSVYSLDTEHDYSKKLQVEVHPTMLWVYCMKIHLSCKWPWQYNQLNFFRYYSNFLTVYFGFRIIGFYRILRCSSIIYVALWLRTNPTMIRIRSNRNAYYDALNLLYKNSSITPCP